MKASVVICVYDQRSRLLLTLTSFFRQTSRDFEVVVVDDGSTDNPHDVLDELEATCSVQWIRQENRGRAAARNRGLDAAKAPVVIFNDADRVVRPTFVEQHLRFHQNGSNRVVVGDIMEIYLSRFDERKEMLRGDVEGDFTWIQHHARRYPFAGLVFNLYRGGSGVTHPLVWMSFFTGNVSVQREHCLAAGGFCEDFVGWGCENFELGLRMLRDGATYYHNPAAANYHLAHERPGGFYREAFAQALAHFHARNPRKEVLLLEDFLFGKISLQDYATEVGGNEAAMVLAGLDPLFHRQLVR